QPGAGREQPVGDLLAEDLGDPLGSAGPDQAVAFAAQHRAHRTEAVHGLSSFASVPTGFAPAPPQRRCWAPPSRIAFLKYCSTRRTVAQASREDTHMVPTSATSTDVDAPDASTVLVTGFGPFGPHRLNPSGQVALGLDGAVVAGARVTARRFDTSSATIASAFAAALDEVRPDLVICLGLAPGRPALSLERIAVN